MSDEEKLVVLEFMDGEARNVFLVKTQHSKETIQKVAEKLRDIYELIGFEDWSYSEIVEDMSYLKMLSIINHEEYVVRL